MRPFRPPLRAPRPAGLLAGCAVVAALFGATAAPAAAADPSPAATSPASTINFGVRPADEREYFHVDLAAGETSVRPATVINFSPEPVDLLIYPADATVTAQGGFALADRGAPVRGVGDWVHLPVGRVHLAGYAQTDIPFRITVPAATTPGDYAGGVVVQRVAPGTTSTVQKDFAVQLNIIQRVGARIYLHVDGTAHAAMQVGALTWRRAGTGVTFSVPVRNTGNVRLHPTAALRLAGFHLPTAAIATNRVEDLLPGSAVTITGRLSRPPLYGAGTATAVVGDGLGHRTSRRASITLIPILPLLGLLAGVALLGYALYRFVRFLRRARAALRQTGQVAPAARRKGHRRLPAQG